MPNDDPFFKREAEKYAAPIASREFILSYLEQQSIPVKFAQLARHFSVIDDTTQTQALKRRLRAMERDGQVVCTRNRCYMLPQRLNMVSGFVIGHPDGYGFLRPDEGGSDYFLSPKEMNKLMHGDSILAQVLPQTVKGKQELRCVRVLEPRSSEIVGRYFVESGVGVVVPDDRRIHCQILIPQEASQGVRHGQMVVAELETRKHARQHAVGRIKEILGGQMDPGMEIAIALRAHQIPHQWPETILKQSQGIKEVIPKRAIQGRVDLRDLPLCTIDGADARDFDDAVYCQTKSSGGWRLWVAIADVAYYVRPDSALDQEAAQRGNSVYFPGEVVPMLPEVLSNGLCSLNPHVDRLCMVCEMTISAAGRLSGYRFYEGVMSSHARFTYERVAALLDGSAKADSKEQRLIAHLQELECLFNALKVARRQRGAIEFETQETQFVFNAQRKIEQILPKERNKAHKIIEECMILANVAAARWVEKQKASALFRVHESPSDEKVGLLRKFLAELGLTLGGGVTPKPIDFARLAAQVVERVDAPLIQTVLLRSMRQAIYQADNKGHFGLALNAYAHFTSPIRRYPDLLLHRTLKALIAGGNPSKTGGHFYLDDQLSQLAEYCSMTERRADDATRDVSDWLKCEFMQDHVGGQFGGMISTVSNFGFFVRLDALHIDGLVHVSQLRNDYYHYDQHHQQLIGEHTRIRYRVGDKVTVRILSVRLDERKIDFALVQDPAAKPKFCRGALQKSKATTPRKKTQKTTEKKSAKKRSRIRRSSRKKT